jgi:hypothetical protein
VEEEEGDRISRGNEIKGEEEEEGRMCTFLFSFVKVYIDKSQKRSK